MPSALKVLIDWARNGTYTDAHDDVTLRVRGGVAGRVEVEQGRDVTNVLPQVIVGRGQVTLDNRDRKFSFRNTASPLNGLVRPGRPFSLQRAVGAVAGAGGTLWSLFSGRTDDSDAWPDLGPLSVSLGLVDVLADLRPRKVSKTVGLKKGIRTGDAITALLDDIGWTAGRDIDPGVSVLPLWWEEGNSVLEAIGRLLSSEGPPAFVTVDGSGTFVYRDRHHRLLDTVSNTSQSVWRGSGRVEPLLGKDFRYGESWSTIVNDVQATLETRALGALEVLWSSDETYLLSPLVGGVTDVLITASDPFTNPQPLVEGLDYTRVSGPALTSAAIGIIASQVGPSTFLRFIAPGPTPTIITNVRFRAQPIRVTSTVTVEASDLSSQTNYGLRSLPGDDVIGPWCSPLDAQAIADQIIIDRALPLLRATAPFQVGKSAGGSPAASIARANAVLGRQVSHRVTLDIPQDGLTADPFYVEHVRHDIGGEEDHVVTVTLEEVPNATPAPSGATAFRFDTTGQGFDQGKFAR